LKDRKKTKTSNAEHRMDATNALPKLVPPYGSMPPTFWEQHGTVVLAGSFVFLALAAGVVWRILKPKPQPVLPPVTVAREVLAKCRARPEDKKVLSEVSQAFRRYLGAVLELPAGEPTTAEICGELERSAKLTPELTGDISNFLRACDERKFSPADISAPLNAADRALEFIVAIELRDCPRKDVRAT
jgi:hypothetical protein